jgi:hypothetical protein
MNCITNTVSQRYITLLQKQGVHITDTDYINAWVSWDSMGNRAKSGLAKTIVLQLHEMSKRVDTGTPVFRLLNLVVSKNGSKHAMCFVLTEIEDNKYTLEIFDSNGLMVDNGKYPLDTFVLNLTSLVASKYASEYKCKVKAVQTRGGENNPNLNTIGGGNCDALMLYYIALRSKYTMFETNAILDSSPMNLKRIKSINEAIAKKKSF